MTNAHPASFRPGLALTLQAAFALATTLSLAYWQYGRGADKAAMSAARSERLAAPAIVGAHYRTDTPDFTRIKLTGRFDGERAFLARAIRGGKPGFDVVTPFDTSHGIFLVHRGWAEASRVRGELPTPEVPLGVVEIEGVVWPLVGVAPALREMAWPEGWPKPVGVMDIERMAEMADAHPREIRLGSNAPGVLAPPSMVYDLSPGTHWSYAVQWLLIGVAVVIGYVIIGRRRAKA